MEKGKFILSIDQGTTGTRAVVYDANANRVSYSYMEHRQIYPKPGWVEHDPLEIWENTLKVVREAVEKAGIGFEDIASIGVTNQRETTVAWDPRTGMPVYNAIVWQDTRTIELCEELKSEGLEPEIKRRTGLTISTYFSSTKIRWILDNVPGASEKAEKGELYFGTIDTWIIWNLTGGRDGGAYVTDPSNASRTMLMGIERLEWDSSLLEIFGIPEHALPEIKPSSSKDPYGYTSEKLFGAKIPVSADLGDQQAALFGQTAFSPGETKNTYGTGNFLLMNIGDKPKLSQHGLLTTVAYKLSGENVVYALEGSIAVTGAAIQWLRDNLGLIKEAREIDELAEKAGEERSAGVYFVPAFSGLYAPYWDMTARGLIIGLTRFVRKEHLAFATLEVIALRTVDVARAMEMDSGIKVSHLKVDGGAAKSNILLQIQADLLGVPVTRPVNTETTSLGAAFAAGLAVDVWESLEDLRKLWRPDRTFEPKMSREERERIYREWKRAVERAMGWLEEG